MDLFFKPKDQYEDTVVRHNYYLNLYYGVFSNILTNMFTYKNMDIILSNDLKKSFFTSFYVGCFKDNTRDNILFSPLEPQGEPNILGDYNEFKSLMYDTGKTFRTSEFILGCDKTVRTLSDKIICYIFANKVADILISIDVAIVDSRLQNVFVGTENEIKDMLAKWEKRNIGVPLTVELPSMKNFDVKVEQLEKPSQVTELYNAYRDVINEFMMVTGLASVMNPNKKERLVAGETQGYDGIRTTVYLDKYCQRQKFIEEINNKYGTKYEVIPNMSLSILYSEEDENKGVDENYVSTEL